MARDKNYSIRLPKRSADEIGALIEGFNEMLSQIQERDANLERRVEERTAQLRQENTDRRRAEDALHASQALYHSLVEQLPVGVFRKDGEGRYVFVNPWFCRLKKVAPEHFLGKTPAEVAQLELEARTGAKTKITELAGLGADHHRLIMETGRQIEREEHYPAEPGKEEQYLHVLKSPVTHADGKIVGSHGILIDITRRKEAEAELEKIHRQLLDTRARRAWRRWPPASSTTSAMCSTASMSLPTVVAENIKKSRTTSFANGSPSRACSEHEQTSGTFITSDPKGKQLPAYLAQLSEHSPLTERETLLNEVESSCGRTLSTSRRLWRCSKVTPEFGVKEMSKSRSGGRQLAHEAARSAPPQVEVIREFADVPPINVEKHKVLQILVNLIRNAKYACDESGRPTSG